MSLLVESIKIYNGRFYGLDLHENRMTASRQNLFNVSTPLHLRKHIQIPESFKKGLVKCRILYNTQIRDIQFSNYSIRNILNAKLVYSDIVNYPHKFLQREVLDTLYQQRDNCDEIVIIRNRLVTDAYYYNLVFEKNKHLYTPAYPLLYGTQRQRLINNKKIIPIDITADSIELYEKIHFINALTPLHASCISPEQLL